MSSNDQEREIVEDTPHYRSVMIAGPLSAPPMPRSFASVRPFKTAPQSLKHEKPIISGAAVWSVADLPSLPAAYFLERSSVYVEGDAQEIANRICDCLRKQSIAASCDGDDKNLLVAETCDCVKFAVRLFADQGKIVVEVQRKCGCSFQFRETARAVLRSAAKGDTTEAPKRKFTMPSCIPRDTLEQQQQRAESGLEVALQQLCSDRLDSQLIGMESLEQVTRCESRGHVSKKVLEGSCLEKVLSAAQADATDARCDIEEQHISVMKRRAITVLANALCAISKLNELEVFLEGCAQLKSESFICNLVETLREASTQPHEATQAARCMQHLMASKDVQSVLIEMSAISVVSDACTTGASRSTLLEQESKKLKMQLSSV